MSYLCGGCWTARTRGGGGGAPSSGLIRKRRGSGRSVGDGAPGAVGVRPVPRVRDVRVPWRRARPVRTVRVVAAWPRPLRCVYCSARRGIIACVRAAARRVAPVVVVVVGGDRERERERERRVRYNV